MLSDNSTLYWGFNKSGEKCGVIADAHVVIADARSDIAREWLMYLLDERVISDAEKHLSNKGRNGDRKGGRRDEERRREEEKGKRKEGNRRR